MPVSGRHEKGIPVLQDHFISFCQPYCGIFFKLQLVLVLAKILFEVDKAQDLPGFPVELVLLFKREKQYPLATNELRMNDMGEVDVKMHVCHRALSPNEQHGVTFHKSLHQLLGPFEVPDQLGSVLENIE